MADLIVDRTVQVTTERLVIVQRRVKGPMPIVIVITLMQVHLKFEQLFLLPAFVLQSIVWVREVRRWWLCLVTKCSFVCSWTTHTEPFIFSAVVLSTDLFVIRPRVYAVRVVLSLLRFSVETKPKVNIFIVMRHAYKWLNPVYGQCHNEQCRRKSPLGYHDATKQNDSIRMLWTMRLPFYHQNEMKSLYSCSLAPPDSHSSNAQQIRIKFISLTAFGG